MGIPNSGGEKEENNWVGVIHKILWYYYVHSFHVICEAWGYERDVEKSYIVWEKIIRQKESKGHSILGYLFSTTQIIWLGNTRSVCISTHLFVCNFL